MNASHTPQRHDNSAPPRVVNLSELNPAWQWIGHRVRNTLPDWHHVTSGPPAGTDLSGIRALFARAASAVQAGRLLAAHPGPGVLVAHGPRPAQYYAQFGRWVARPTLALVFSFNYTVLPQGRRRQAAARAFTHMDSFIVASRTEQALYASHFDLDPARLHMLHWGVRPPLEALAAPPLVPGPYLCALGSQGRDYATLIEAMRHLPNIRLVLVATPGSLPPGGLPSNVELRVNIPQSQAMNLLAHSRFMALPMRDAQVPCGHVTVVSAMHLGKAVVATDTVGLHDYLRPEDNALLVPPSDPMALAHAIEQLWEKPELAHRLGTCGQAFAQTHCTEDAVVACFSQQMRAAGLWPTASTS